MLSSGNLSQLGKQSSDKQSPWHFTVHYTLYKYNHIKVETTQRN